MAELVAVGFDPFKKSATPDDFSARYGSAAEKAAKALGVEPSVVLGQWGLETGWGKSVIPGTNNLGNIKDFAGGGVAATDNMNGSRDKYRAYDSPDQFVDDYVSLIQRKYPSAVNAKTPEDFAKALKSGGYAEDPGYVAKVTTAAKMTPVKAVAGPTLVPVDHDPFAAAPTAASAPDAVKTAGGGAQGSWAPEPSISKTERFLKGVRDPIDGGAQLLTKMLPEGLVNAGNQANNLLADKTGLVARLPEGGVDQQVREQEAAYQAKRGKDAGFDGYRVLGNVASPANAALAMRAPAAATLAGRVGTSAAIGAGSAGMAPVTNGDNFLAEKAKQVGLGAAFGGAAPVVTGAIGRLISPNASVNPLLQLLQREGVRPTIGQTLGGVANRMEERAMSVPILGDAIANARGLATRQLNEAALNRATAPIGVRSQGVGQGAVQQAGDEIGAAYNAARNALGSFRLDQQATRDVQQLRNMAAQLPDRERAAFERVWESIATDISPNGTIPAAVFKRIDSKLGSEAAKFSKSGDAYQQSLGQALEELQNAISNAGRRANPRADAMFRAADEGYANLVRVEGAAKASHNAEGVFSPAQLNAAIRQADQSVRGRSVSRGTALMQDLGNAGQQVLGNRVPNSGTADRLMQLGAGGALVSNPLLTIGGGAAGMAMYTQPMQALLRGAVTARPQSAQAVRNALLEASTRLSPGAAQIGIGLAE